MPDCYNVGIILGHIYTGFGYTGRQKRRMEKGCELLRTGRVERLMTTGGKGMWNKTAPCMAEVARDYLIQRQGIDSQCILVEKESATTLQNAEYALRLMQEQHLTSLIVITSADHMPRARSIFREVFPSNFTQDFVISDYFCGIWSLVDFFWNCAGQLKRRRKQASQSIDC
jgi:uncharacterized SAM-binding protein YcdF (DUF218 family)